MAEGCRVDGAGLGGLCDLFPGRLSRRPRCLSCSASWSHVGPCPPLPALCPGPPTSAEPVTLPFCTFRLHPVTCPGRPPRAPLTLALPPHTVIPPATFQAEETLTCSRGPGFPPSRPPPDTQLVRNRVLSLGEWVTRRTGQGASAQEAAAPSADR